MAFNNHIEMEASSSEMGKMFDMLATVNPDKDSCGNCECVLSGIYVDEFQRLVDRGGGGLPIIVIQFAKIRYEQGKMSIENYLNVTRILINPIIPEIIAFKESLAIVGVVCVGPHTRPSLDEDFLTRNPPISIANLRKTKKEGFYIVGGIIDSLVEPEQWWYPACSCHASLSPNANGFYCNDCDKDVPHMIPMFKLKLRIRDGTGQEIFVLFEQEMYELLGKHCHELLTVQEKSNINGYDISEKPFRVERICKDLSLIGAFDSPFLNEASDSEDDE
ncbi:replication protein A 70 kDa DNA-binding subunit B [Trifolium repens]|nr:replication protein A 70 kDa DNA-binding subunit B [Trifolium repens]